MVRRRRKKVVRILLWLVLTLLVLVVALPLWFPWVLRPIAKRWGASYAQYHRTGYGRFELTSVSFTNKDGSFHAGRIEAAVPSAWLWRHWFNANAQGRL